MHAQEADRDGNVQLWGIPGVQKEAVLAASAPSSRSSRSSTSSSRGRAASYPGLGDRLRRRGPGRLAPSYASGITERDNDFYNEWDAISRDRELPGWMHDHVLEYAAR